MKHKSDILIPMELGINPYTYLDIALKFEEYIKIIKFFGGYMFLKHIYKFSFKAKRQTFQDIHLMEESKLLKIINVNNNSYAILTKSSIKYLKQKSNVHHLQPPTFTQLKTCCYLAEYVSNPHEFFNTKNPYTWFLEKYKAEIEKYKNKNEEVNLSFLKNQRDNVKRIKEEEIKANNFEDLISKLNSSRIYFDSVQNGVVTFLILDFDRTNNWIHRTLIEKIEVIIKDLKIYTGYNIKILVSNREREKVVLKNLNRIDRSDLIFLKNIEVINSNIDSYFNASKQKESFLKDVDKKEISKLQEKLKNNSK